MNTTAPIHQRLQYPASAPTQIASASIPIRSDLIRWFCGRNENLAESAPDVMRKQLVLGVGLLFAMYSACVPAQVPSVGGLSPASNSSDCLDPASANSPDCSASQYQNGQNVVGSTPTSG